MSKIQDIQSADENRRTSVRDRLRVIAQRREFETLRDELESQLDTPELKPRVRFGLIVNDRHMNS